MRATLSQKSQPVVTPRALERQALHDLDDGRLVFQHLAGVAHPGESKPDAEPRAIPEARV